MAKKRTFNGKEYELEKQFRWQEDAKKRAKELKKSVRNPKNFSYKIIEERIEKKTVSTPGWSVYIKRMR